MSAERSRDGRNPGLPGLVLVLLPWVLLGGGAGCLTGPLMLAPNLCPGPATRAIYASSGIGTYTFEYPDSIVEARGVDWVGQSTEGVELDGPLQGCFQGGSVTGTWDPAASWETYHLTAALSIRTESRPTRIYSFHARNYGDGVSIEPYVPCPNGSPNPWLQVRASHLEFIHDDAIESDGLCGVEVADNLIDRAFVAFAFRNRISDPARSGALNDVFVDGNLVRLHAFPNNYAGQLTHGPFWKWAHDGRGPRITVRNNRFLAFDAGGGLFPHLNRVVSCQNNVLLFAGSEAEWNQALASGCDDDGNDGVCDGERMLALSGCYSVITKPDTQSEAAFLATHWDPYVASWKTSHGADDE